jgi:UDP-N-acetyl-D-galactosamine dehydrogenase
MSSVLPLKSEFSGAQRVFPPKADIERIAVVGLGYVGLPLCMALARHHVQVLGFDIAAGRIRALQAGRDATGEIEPADLLTSTARLTTDPAALADSTFYIVTVPTPVDANRQPDLSPLHQACDLIGSYLKRGDVVVFESTVYPGVTEDVCGPRLAARSGLRAHIDFHLGYSPERINPGDRVNSVETIVKLVSGDTPQTLDRVSAVYRRAIRAGVHPVPSIKIAECAKVIENTQRDVNIALMNELSLICGRIGVDTNAVIDAAGTKWNFQKFRPGLVGGHCIGVDPYYLAALAETLGLEPEVILAGRRVNDRMADHVAERALDLLLQRRGYVKGARVGLFGVTFKEDVPDIRNSRSFDLIARLSTAGVELLVQDPLADPVEVERHGVTLSGISQMTGLDMMVIAVGHRDYRAPEFVGRHLLPDGVLIDIKGIQPRGELPGAINHWTL